MERKKDMGREKNWLTGTYVPVAGEVACSAFEGAALDLGSHFDTGGAGAGCPAVCVWERESVCVCVGGGGEQPLKPPDHQWSGDFASSFQPFDEFTVTQIEEFAGELGLQGLGHSVRFEDGDDDYVKASEIVDSLQVDAINDVPVAEEEEAWLAAKTADDASSTADEGSINMGWDILEMTTETVLLGLQQGVLESICAALGQILLLPEFFQLSAAHRSNDADLAREGVGCKEVAGTSINRNYGVEFVEIEVGGVQGHRDGEVDVGMVASLQGRDKTDVSMLHVRGGDRRGEEKDKLLVAHDLPHV